VVCRSINDEWGHVRESECCVRPSPVVNDFFSELRSAPKQRPLAKQTSLVSWWWRWSAVSSLAALWWVAWLLWRRATVLTGRRRAITTLLGRLPIALLWLTILRLLAIASLLLTILAWRRLAIAALRATEPLARSAARLLLIFAVVRGIDGSKQQFDDPKIWGEIHGRISARHLILLDLEI